MLAAEPYFCPNGRGPSGGAQLMGIVRGNSNPWGVRQLTERLCCPQFRMNWLSVGPLGTMRRLLGNTDIGADGGRQARRAFAGALAALFLGLATGTATAEDSKVFIIGNYPVEARAADAVTAKEQAIADGQQAAFRSLLKRIVPVTSYGRLKQIRATPAAPMIEGFSVRSERNSATEYIASYDFSFQPAAVQQLLERNGIPYVDKQAPRIVIVPIYRAERQPQNVTAEASDTWMYAWRSLDLANTLTPATISQPKKTLNPDTVKAALEGEGGAQRAVAGEYQTSLVVLAVLEPSADGKKATVTLSGQDSVGPFSLARNYRLDGDIAYTSELAAVVGLGVLEGRWKAANSHLSTASAPAQDNFAPAPSGGGGSGYGWGASPGASPGYGEGPSSYGARGSQPSGGAPIRLSVSFQGMNEWQQISQRLSAVPGVGNLEVEGLSARSARIALSFPGSPDDLARALSQQGLSLRSGPDGLILSGGR